MTMPREYGDINLNLNIKYIYKDKRYILLKGFFTYVHIDIVYICMHIYIVKEVL